MQYIIFVLLLNIYICPIYIYLYICHTCHKSDTSFCREALQPSRSSHHIPGGATPNIEWEWDFLS